MLCHVDVLPKMFKLAVILILFLIGIGFCESYGQDKKERDSLFGVTLTGHAQAILKKVEQIYEKEVREEWMPVSSSQAGNSKVGDDGAPIIYIHPSTGRNVSTIVHELYHFVQRAEGYPAIMWLMPVTMDTKENQLAFHQLAQQLYDPILHYAFFDTLISLNIRPNEPFELGTRQVLQNGTLDSIFETMDKRAIALYYFKARLELKDAALLEQIVVLLNIKNKDEGLALGQKIAHLVLDSTPLNPKESVGILVQCLNLIYEAQFDFKQREWTSRQLGKHLQKIVSIELRVL